MSAVENDICHEKRFAVFVFEDAPFDRLVPKPIHRICVVSVFVLIAQVIEACPAIALHREIDPAVASAVELDVDIPHIIGHFAAVVIAVARPCAPFFFRGNGARLFREGGNGRLLLYLALRIFPEVDLGAVFALRVEGRSCFSAHLANIVCPVGVILMRVFASRANSVFVSMDRAHRLFADGTGVRMPRFRLGICAEGMLLVFIVAGCAFAVFVDVCPCVLALRGMGAGGGVPMAGLVARPCRRIGVRVSATRKGKAKAEGGNERQKGGQQFVFHVPFLLKMFLRAKK